MGRLNEHDPLYPLENEKIKTRKKFKISKEKKRRRKEHKKRKRKFRGPEFEKMWRDDLAIWKFNIKV